jgi:phenol/toluene 2-monooxygenase (NADH) P1/A1
MLSRVGIALGGGAAEILKAAKLDWLDGEHLQPLRRLVEEIMVVDDWAEGVLAIDAIDKLIYPAFYQGLDDAALLGGAGAYSLVAQHLTTWFADQRKWLDALVASWVGDEHHGEANREVLARIEQTWGGRAEAAVAALQSVVRREIGDVA